MTPAGKWRRAGYERNGEMVFTFVWMLNVSAIGFAVHDFNSLYGLINGRTS